MSAIGGWFGRHWRGESGFWVSVLINALLIVPLAIAGGTIVQVYAAVDGTPGTRITLGLVIAVVIALLAIWQLVGAWRVSSSGRATDRMWITRWLARLTSLAIAALAVAYLGLQAKGLGQIQSLATDSDEIGLRGYSLAVEDDQLRLNGIMAWSLVDKFMSELDSNPQVRVVVLDSPGGHIAVGRRLADEISRRRLDTLTTTQCASSCTIAFIAGQRRMIGPRATLGFHSLSAVFDGGKADFLVQLSTQKNDEILRRAGVPDDFIQRIDATPGTELWTPTMEELRGANIVTQVVR